MRKSFSLATVLSLSLLTVANAASVNIDPDVTLYPGASGQTGTLRLIVDTNATGLTFNEGSLGLSVASSNPGVIQITDAVVHNPSFFGNPDLARWNSATAVNVQADSIDELLGLDVNKQGLDSSAPFGDNADGGGPGLFAFADINYTVIGNGTTEISLAPISSRPGTFIVDNGQDATSQINFGSARITVDVPEPSTMLLAGLGMLGLAAGRRRS